MQVIRAILGHKVKALCLKNKVREYGWRVWVGRRDLSNSWLRSGREALLKGKDQYG